MDFKKITFLSVLFISIIAVNFVAFAEEVPVVGSDSAVIASDQQSVVAQEKSDTQWAWGEVTNIDSQAKTVTIKYLDYEADQEKDLILVIDDKTTFENIKGLDELKIKDTLSIDYTTGPDNRNIAKNISLEKTDALSDVPAQTAKEEPKSVEMPAAPSVLAEGQVASPESALTPVSEPALVAVEPASKPAPAAVVAEPAPAVSGQAQ